MRLPASARDDAGEYADRFSTDVQNIRVAERLFLQWLYALNDSAEPYPDLRARVTDEQNLFFLREKESEISAEAAFIEALRAVAPERDIEIARLHRHLIFTRLRHNKAFTSLLPSYDPFVDLTVIVNRHGPMTGLPAQAGTILDQYEQKINDLVAQLDAMAARSVFDRNRMLTEIRIRAPGDRRISTVVNEFVALSTRPVLIVQEMFETNWRTLKGLAAVLPPDMVDAIRAEAVRAILPFLYDDVDPADLIRAALRKEEMTEAQRDVLRGLLASLESKRFRLAGDIHSNYSRAFRAPRLRQRKEDFAYAIHYRDPSRGSADPNLIELDRLTAEWERTLSEYRAKIVEMTGHDLVRQAKSANGAQDPADGSTPFPPFPEHDGGAIVDTKISVYHVGPDDFAHFVNTVNWVEPTTAATLRSMYDEYSTLRAVADQELTRALSEAHAREIAFQQNNPSIRNPWVELEEDFGRYEIFSNHLAKTGEVQRAFEEGVAAMLDTDARHVWTQMIDRIRREAVFEQIRSVHYRAPGDAFAILSELPLSPEEQSDASEPIELYKAQMARVVEEYLARVPSLGIELLRPVDESGRSRRLALHVEIEETIERVTQVNRRLADSMQLVLSPRNREAFDDKFQKRSWPEFYLTTPVDEVVRRIRGSSMISSHDGELLDDLYDDYARKRRQHRESLIRFAHSKYQRDPHKRAGIHPPIAQTVDLEKRTLERIAAVIVDDDARYDYVVRTLLRWSND